MTTRYWFARYSLTPRPSRGLMPIAWEGWAVIFGFVAAMILGGLSMLLLSLLAHQIALGVIVFVVLAIVGGATFIWAAVAKSDPVQTASDYLNAGR
jgi:hypothetical protein